MVLRKIATIINTDAHPLPYPFRNIKQKAVVHQDEYKLEVRYLCFLKPSCIDIHNGMLLRPTQILAGGRESVVARCGSSC